MIFCNNCLVGFYVLLSHKHLQCIHCLHRFEIDYEKQCIRYIGEQNDYYVVKKDQINLLLKELDRWRI